MIAYTWAATGVSVVGARCKKPVALGDNLKERNRPHTLSKRRQHGSCCCAGCRGKEGVREPAFGNTNEHSRSPSPCACTALHVRSFPFLERMVRGGRISAPRPPISLPKHEGCGCGVNIQWEMMAANRWARVENWCCNEVQGGEAMQSNAICPLWRQLCPQPLSTLILRWRRGRAGG